MVCAAARWSRRADRRRSPAPRTPARRCHAPPIAHNSAAAAISSTGSHALARRRLGAAATGHDLVVTSDERRTFQPALESGEQAREFADSLYLPTSQAGTAEERAECSPRALVERSAWHPAAARPERGRR